MAFPTGWSYYKEITIPASEVDANLTDFPWVIKLASDSDLAAHARSDGYDIVITNSDGSVELPYERVVWDDSTGELILWFKADSLSSTVDNKFRIYYGNSSQSTDKQDVTNTWPSNYKRVYHLQGNSNDSSQSNLDGTDNSITYQNAQIGEGAGFNAGGDLIQAQFVNTPSAFTVSFWLRTTRNPLTTTVTQPLQNASTNDSLGFSWDYINSTFNQAFYVRDASLAYTPVRYTASLLANTWYYLTAKWTGSNFRIYLNGSYDKQVPISSFSTLAGNFNLRWGGDSSITDELVYTDNQLSDNWISTTYNNQSDPTGSFTLGSEQSALIALNLTESLSLIDVSDSLVTAKSLIESIFIEDNKSDVFSFTRSLLETIHIETNHDILFAKSLSEAIGLVDDFFTHQSQILNESLSLSDPAISTNTFPTGSYFSETFTLVDQMTRSPQKSFMESITTTDSQSIQQNLLFIEQITTSDVVNFVRELTRTFTETLPLEATNELGVNLLLQETILVDDGIIGLFKSLGVPFTESLSLSDSLSKQAYKQLTETLDLSDQRILVLNKLLTASLSLSDTFRFPAGMSLFILYNVSIGYIKKYYDQGTVYTEKY